MAGLETHSVCLILVYECRLLKLGMENLFMSIIHSPFFPYLLSHLKSMWFFFSFCEFTKYFS